MKHATPESISPTLMMPDTHWPVVWSSWERRILCASTSINACREAKKCRAYSAYQLLAGTITFQQQAAPLLGLVQQHLGEAGNPKTRAKLVNLLTSASRVSSSLIKLMKLRDAALPCIQSRLPCRCRSAAHDDSWCCIPQI